MVFRSEVIKMSKSDFTNDFSDLYGDVGPGHISASQLDSYMNCGESWRRRYIEGEKTPPSLAIIKGQIGHTLLEANSLYKIKYKNDLSVEELLIIFDLAFYKKAKMGIYDPEEDFESLEDCKNKLKEEFELLIPVMLESQKDIKPIEVEKKQEIEIEGLGKSIKLVTDLKTMDGGIVDYKFTGKAKNQDYADSNTGLTVYALAYFNTHKKMPTFIKIHNFYIKNTKKEGMSAHYKEIVTHRTVEDFRVLLDRFKIAINGINTGVYLPAQLDSWSCSAKFCGFFESCKYVNNKEK